MVLLAALSVSAVPLQAQAPLQNALFTAATSAEDSDGKEWAFLLFQLTADIETLFTRRLAIYQKSGGIDQPGDFKHSGNVALHEHPAVIKGLLSRAAALGQSPGDLNFAVNELFGELIPSPELPVEEKLSAVIRGSLGDPRQFANLMLLARMNPGVSLALGLGHAQRIGPGTTSFEVRELDPLGNEIGVIGRVSVEAGKPVVLQAPFAPVAVPELSAMGHLNARLRWGAPDDLRRLSLLQYGFNLYRVDEAYAVSLGWNETPPPNGVLAAAATTLPEIRRVNRAPVLPTAIYNELEALDLEADPSTFFIADDNGLASENPLPFVDGARYYYFVTARDILGRDGHTSQGTPVMIFDRVPPHAPRRPEVSNFSEFAGGNESHRLQVQWRQLESTADEPITGYYVYRWASPGDVQKYAIHPLVNRISDFIPHVPGETRLIFVDAGEKSPEVPKDYGMTFWYSVRAVKQTASGGILSANSSPAFGVLRNRFAPAPPVGKVLITCARPVVEPERIEDVPDVSADDPLRAIFDLICTRDTRTVAWAEFARNDTRDPAQFIGRFHFQLVRKQVRARMDLGRSIVDGNSTTIFCRVGDAGGKISEWVELGERGTAPVGSVRRFIFAASEITSQVVLDDAAIADGCDVHSPGGMKLPDGLAEPLDGQNPTNPIFVVAPLTQHAKEYRVYRRIDEGDMTLWRQGLADEAEANQIILEDGALPPSAGEISYFGQYLDDNGNASELTLLGQHVAVAQPAPRPMLSPPQIDGTDSDPRMKIRWFAPPHGTERFAVILGVKPGPIPEMLIPELSKNNNSPFNKMSPGPDNQPDPDNIPYGEYFTPSLDSGFGPGPAYELSVPVHKGKVYQVQIHAVAKSGGGRTGSTSYTFQWPTEDAAEATGPNVPWPARPLPAVGPVFAADLAPIRISRPDFDGLGVVIGHIPLEAVNASQNLIGENADFRSYLFPADDKGDPDGLLPMMLYRYQVPSTAFPNPSGDLIQVTPLMQNIATSGSNGQRFLRDPFVRLVPSSRASGDEEDLWRIVLLDTQPAVRSSRYAYVLVRFTKDGEVSTVHPIPSIQAF